MSMNIKSLFCLSISMHGFCYILIRWSYLVDWLIVQFLLRSRNSSEWSMHIKWLIDSLFLLRENWIKIIILDLYFVTCACYLIFNDIFHSIITIKCYFCFHKQPSLNVLLTFIMPNSQLTWNWWNQKVSIIQKDFCENYFLISMSFQV